MEKRKWLAGSVLTVPRGMVAWCACPKTAPPPHGASTIHSSFLIIYICPKENIYVEKEKKNSSDIQAAVTTYTLKGKMPSPLGMGDGVGKRESYNSTSEKEGASGMLSTL